MHPFTTMFTGGKYHRSWWYLSVNLAHICVCDELCRLLTDDYCYIFISLTATSVFKLECTSNFSVFIKPMKSNCWTNRRQTERRTIQLPLLAQPQLIQYLFMHCDVSQWSFIASRNAYKWAAQIQSQKGKNHWKVWSVSKKYSHPLDFTHFVTIKPQNIM